MTLSDSSLSDGSDDDYPRKRRKQTKEDRMLGIFGSDSDEHESGSIYKKTLHTKGVSFQKAGDASSEDKQEADEDYRPSFQTARALGELYGDTKNESSKSTSHLKSYEQAARIPTFGMYSDSSTAFIPSAKPTPSRESPMTNRSGRSNFVPLVSKTGQAANKQPPTGPGMKLGNSKAAQMMAKMGYKAGEGLGTSGKGIVNPIEAKLRPGQKAGLGSIDEQSASEPSNRLERPVKEARARSGAIDTTKKTRKVKYRTAQEIVDDAGGDLRIPKSLQAIIDMTRGEPKKLTSVSNIEATQANALANQTYHVAQIARKEVEQYAADWRRLQDRKVYIAAELERSRSELSEAIRTLKVMDDLHTEVHRMTSPLVPTHDEITDFNRLVHGLTAVATKFAPLAGIVALDEVAASLLMPLFKKCIASWEVLAEPSRFVPELNLLARALPRNTERSSDTSEASKRKASPLEALMATIWLPRIRTTINTESSLTDAVLNLLETWSTLTPQFLRDQIIAQLVMPRLTEKIQKWNPRASRDSDTLLWLFQWLPYLASHITEVAGIVRRKFILVVSQWKPTNGLIRGLRDWAEILGPTEVQKMLLKQVLPKLAEVLRRQLVINPADQKLDKLNEVLVWRHDFDTMIMANLLKAEFFPKWTQMLYNWLRNDPDFEEVSEWYEWWQDVIPDELLDLEPIRSCFSNALKMMDITLDRGSEYLEAPAVGPKKPLDHTQHLADKAKSTPAKHSSSALEEADITFKDVLVDWCENHNCLLVPLRRAHESGNALYKITASTTNSRGAVIYIRGDIIMLQDTEQRTFRATSLAGLATILGVTA